MCQNVRRHLPDQLCVQVCVSTVQQGLSRRNFCCSGPLPGRLSNSWAVCSVRVCEPRRVCAVTCFLNLSVTQNQCVYFITVTHYLPKKSEKKHLHSVSRIYYGCSKISHKYKINSRPNGDEGDGSPGRPVCAESLGGSTNMLSQALPSLSSTSGA